MNFPPYLTSVLWFGAAACLILLLLVIFGYHLYQRSRFKAITGDGASVARLAARKETLEADVEELRAWIAEHKAEQEKLMSERRQQELARVDLAQLEEQLAAKRHESQNILGRMAELDIALEKRRQFHGRLEAEIKSLEEQRQELAPLEKYVQDLRSELDQGRVRLAQMAQEEVRVQALQTQAHVLRQELRELSQQIQPLRDEKAKLRQFLEQARHATAVKNEQLLDQKQQIRQIESQIAALELKKNELEKDVAKSQNSQTEITISLGNLRQECNDLKKQAAESRFAAQAEQAQLEMLLQRREELVSEIAALTGRNALLQRDMELLGQQLPPEAEAEEIQKPGRRRKNKSTKLFRRHRSVRPMIKSRHNAQAS